MTTSALLASFAAGTLAGPAVLLWQQSRTLAARRARRWQARQTRRNYKHERARMNERHAADRANLAAGFDTAAQQLAEEQKRDRARLARTYGKGRR
jgi:hypothetical protein